MTGSQFRTIYRLAAEKIGRPRHGGNFTVFDRRHEDGSSIHLYMSHNLVSLSIRLHEDDERNKNIICIEPYRCGDNDVNQILATIKREVRL